MGVLIDKELNEESMWTMEVKSFGGGIWMGMCLEGRARKGKWMPGNWLEEVGHGHYLVSTKGRVVSHSDKKVNWSTTSLRVNVGETVLMDYDGKKLKFMVGEGSFELDVVPPPMGDVYKPCVYLWKTTDVVELLHNS